MTIRGQDHLADVASILKWECRGDIGSEIEEVDLVPNRTQQ